MVTQSVSNQQTPNQYKSSKKDLASEDFIKMMLTQLQNQDPLSPAKNEELMAQMSQIGQLQSSTQLRETLQGLALQNQLSSAGNLIGKMVEGLDDQNETVSGVVTSVRVEKDKVILELDNAHALPLERVTTITAASSTAV